MLLSLVVVNMTIHGSSKPIDKDDSVARVTINHQLDDKSKILITARLSGKEIRRKEVWKFGCRVFSDTYIRKPMFERKDLKRLHEDKSIRIINSYNRPPMYISQSVKDLESDDAKQLKNAIDQCWDEARINYRGKHTVWVWNENGQVTLVSKNGVPVKPQEKIARKLVSVGDDSSTPDYLSESDDDKPLSQMLTQEADQEE